MCVLCVCVCEGVRKASAASIISSAALLSSLNWHFESVALIIEISTLPDDEEREEEKWGYSVMGKY